MNCSRSRGFAIRALFTKDGIELANILRDFKKFSSKEIVRFIKEGTESRREWLLDYFLQACEHLKREQQYKVWQDGNQPKIIYTPSFFWDKP